jgi:hypothetical protein
VNYDFIVEKWDAGFQLVSDSLLKLGELETAFDIIREHKYVKQGHRFTICSEDNGETLYLVIETPNGGGRAKICGLRTGQRG